MINPFGRVSVLLNKILLFSISCFFFLASAHAISLEEDLDWNIATGMKYFDISIDSDSEGGTSVSNMVARIRADLAVMDRFFISATGRYDLLMENERETLYRGGDLIQENSFSYGERSLELCGGMKLLPLFHPYFGFAISELKIDRWRIQSENRVPINDRIVNAYDLLLGVRGNYTLNDYTSLGYYISYQTSPNSEAEFQNDDFENVDTSGYSTEIFLKYWLPNELMEVGLHLYGGRYLMDMKSAANQLLPDTDIKYVGAFVSFRLNL